MHTPKPSFVDMRAVIAAYALGVLVVFMGPALPELAVCLLLAVSGLWPWRGQRVWAAFVLGVLFCTWRAQAALEARLPVARHAQVVQVEGVIASLPEARRVAGATAGAGGDARGAALVDWRFDFVARAPVQELPSKVRVSWYRTAELLRAGQCWRLELKLRAPHGSANPGGFDYEAWLLRNHIAATASVRSAVRCADDGGGWLLRARAQVVDVIRNTLGDSAGAALMAALSVGDTRGLTALDWQRFRATGTSHLVAISGLHLGIVAGALFWLLRWVWALWPRACLWLPAQRLALLGSGLGAGAYALLAGLQPPVLRALIMLWVFIAAALLHRLHQSARALLFAWAVIVTLDPLAILSPGLWLSFGAVAAIIYIGSGRLRAPGKWQLALTIQLFLSLALVPLTLWFFGGFTWLSPLVNLLAIPVFTVLVPLLLAALLLYAIAPSLGVWGIGVCGRLLEWAYAALAWSADGLPQAWQLASPHPAALVLGAIGAGLLFAPRGLPLRALGVLGVLALAVPRTHSLPALSLTALDVGQGTAIVVRTAQHTLLYDAGPAYPEGFDAGASVVVPYLLARGVRQLDALVLSHGDNDHAGGVAAVRAALPIMREIGTDAGAPCQRGQQWEWDGVRFEILHPDARPWRDNNSSCVLRISGVFTALLPGDIERAAEAHLLAEHASALRAQVLLAPHHGSATSSTAGFIAAVAPELVIHSAGWRSRFGHPRADVVQRYDEVRAQQWTTGVEGAIEVFADATGALQVQRYRAQSGRWWHAPAQP